LIPTLQLGQLGRSFGPGAASGTTWNSARNTDDIVYTNGDRTIATASSGQQNTISLAAIGASDKIYVEVLVDTITGSNDCPQFGVASSSVSDNQGAGTTGVWVYLLSRGWYWLTSGYTTGKATFSAGNRCMVAVDRAANKIWFGKNGTWNDSGDPAAGTNAAATNLSGTLHLVGLVNSTSQITLVAAADFSYSPPSGFSALV
jgi:hypothetical protein